MYRADPVEFLVLRMFRAKLVNHVRRDVCDGPYREQAEEYTGKVRIYETVLRTLSGPTLAALVADEREFDQQIDEEHEHALDKYRFFSKPSASANHGYWLTRQAWSLDEATALILGKDPEVVTWESIKPLTNISPFAQRFFGIRRHLKLAQFSGRLCDPVNPRHFTAWALENGVVLPPELEARHAKPARSQHPDGAATGSAEDPSKPRLRLDREDAGRHRPIATPGSEKRVGADERPANVIHIDRQAARLRAMHERIKAAALAKEEPATDTAVASVDALGRMALAMAVGRYGYAPGTSRTSTVTDIVSDLRRVGLDLPAATVTQWLRRVSECVPAEDDGEQGESALGLQG